MPLSIVLTDSLLFLDSRGKLIDSSIRKDRKKKGRPDIVHRALLTITDSPLYRTKPFDVYIHTAEGRVFRVEKGIRPPRNYIRFCGLMEQLLKRGYVGPKGSPLICTTFDLDKHLSSVDLVVALSEKGEAVDPLHVVKCINGLDCVVLVGCFHKGDISPNIMKKSDIKISLADLPLAASAAIAIFLSLLYYAERWSAEKDKGETEENS
jgi:rRNA small subunit pseudouridine methyltransferase Nep1